MKNFLQAINSAKERAVQMSAVRFAAGWARAVPLKLWLAAGALIFAALWLHEHDARVRAAVEAQQMKQQTAQQVAALETQARAAIASANRENATTISLLEGQRRKLAGRADELSAQLEALKRQQQKRSEEIAALPPAVLAKQLATRLGPSSFAHGPLSPAANHGEVSHASLQEGGSPSWPERPAAGTPPLQQERKSAVRTAPLQLTDAGAQRVASTLDDLDSCHARSAIQARQVSTCGEQLATDEAEIQTQKDSLAKLNQALAAKDRILSEREKEFKTELTAARGTWRGRAMKALKFMAVGVGIGLVIK